MSKLTIGKKLYLGVGALVLFTFGMGISAVLSLSGIGDRTHTIVDKTVYKQGLEHEMDTQSSDLLAGSRGVLVRGYMKDLPTARKYNDQYNAALDAMQSDVNVVTPLLVTATGKQAMAEIQQSIGQLRDAEQSMMGDVAAGKMDDAINVYTQTELPALKSQKMNVVTLLHIQDQLMTGDKQAVESAITSGMWVTGVVLAISCAVGIVLILVVRQVNAVLRRSVEELSESSVQIASAAG